jgi:energy-coupling factor transporter ATP-binding protein EcfA2
MSENEKSPQNNNSVEQHGMANVAVQHIEGSTVNITINQKSESKSKPILDNIEPDVKLLFDSLKDRYKKRYDSKLDGRFEITLEVNKEPFTVNYQTNKNIDEAFKAINESFNQKGRLLIVGSPGSGKTVLLLKLALELLGDECQAEQKLPVIFNLASWSEDYASFEDWLIDVLNSGNGLSKDFARTLLHEKRIIFLLDGLDELARNEEPEVAHQKRAECLASLNDYLREGRKAVICCRQEEFLKMSSETNQLAPVDSTVKVNDLSKPEIILALQHAQTHNESRASATNLLQIIETNEVFLDVLSTPFYFTTALEVFDKQLLNEKDFPTDEAEVKKYLLDRFIESKLNHTNKLTAFEKDKAKAMKWLSWLARLMDESKITTFEIAELQPIDIRNKWIYKLIIATTISLFGIPIFFINLLILIFKEANKSSQASSFFSELQINPSRFESWFPLIKAIKYPVLFGILFGFCILFLSGNSQFARSLYLASIIIGFFTEINSNLIITEDINTWKLTNFLRRFSFWTSLKFSLFFGIGFGVFAGIPSGLAFLLFPDNYSDRFELSVAMTLGSFILWSLLGTFLAFVVSFIEAFHETNSFVSLKNPYQRFRGGFFPNTIISVLIISIFPGFWFLSIVSDSSFAIIVILSCLIIYGILLGFSITPLFKHLILRFCLYLEGSMPLKYATFLDLAAEARILEKDGGHWRFRHQTLQEHFANLKD